MVASAALLLGLWALSLGPVALVTPLLGTRSFFVVLYSTVLAMRFRELLGEQVSTGAVTVKFVSVALIIAGIGIISLG